MISSAALWSSRRDTVFTQLSIYSRPLCFQISRWDSGNAAASSCTTRQARSRSTTYLHRQAVRRVCWLHSRELCAILIRPNDSCCEKPQGNPNNYTYTCIIQLSRNVLPLKRSSQSETKIWTTCVSNWWFPQCQVLFLHSNDRWNTGKMLDVSSK